MSTFSTNPSSATSPLRRAAILAAEIRRLLALEVRDAIALLIKACLDKIEAGQSGMVPAERRKLAASIAFASVHEFCLMLGRSVEEDIEASSAGTRP